MVTRTDIGYLLLVISLLGAPLDLSLCNTICMRGTYDMVWSKMVTWSLDRLHIEGLFLLPEIDGTARYQAKRFRGLGFPMGQAYL